MYWRRVDLQCCVSFRCTVMWISYTYIYSFFFRFVSQYSHYIVLNRALCAIREDNGTPLQRSCLENPRDGASWWAAVYGVAQSQTQLKWLSSSSSSVLYSRFLLVIYLIYSSVNIGEGNGIPLQYSCLEYPMDGGDWLATAHGVTKSWTQLSN